MPIKADQLQEKKDFQRLILDELHDRNDYKIRSAQTDWSADYAMDTGLLFEFLEATQPDGMEKLRKFYKDKTEKTVINYINREMPRSGADNVGVRNFFTAPEGKVLLSLDFSQIRHLSKPSNSKDNKSKTRLRVKQWNIQHYSIYQKFNSVG